MPPATQKKRLSKKQRDARKKRKIAEVPVAASKVSTGAAFPLLSSKKKQKKLPDAAAEPAKLYKIGSQPKPTPKGNANKPQTKQHQGKLPIFSGKKQPVQVSDSESESEDEGTWDTRKPTKAEKIELDFDGVEEAVGESDSDNDDDVEEEDEEDDEEDDEDEHEEKEDAEKEAGEVRKQPAMPSKVSAQVKPKSQQSQQTAPVPHPSATSDDDGGSDSDGDEDVADISTEPVTMYVNQLPFEATKEQIVAHFASCGVVECRMCLDKSTKTFRGTAFLVVQDGAKALALHLSKLGSRVINVRPQLSHPELVAVAEKGQAIKRNIAKQQGQSHKGKKPAQKRAK